jgi:predicted kinase
LIEAYASAAGDGEGRGLVPFYTSYRAAVRGKVEGLKAAEAEVPAEERETALAKARGYWLMALGELEQPASRPCLVLVAGLPGAGKSTLAADLAEQAGLAVIRSDVVRKELAGVAAEASSAARFGEGIYTAEWNARTYAECLRRAEELLFEGRRVAIDASFWQDGTREAFLCAAFRWRAPAVILVCQASGETRKDRLAARRGDASDADWSVASAAAEQWEAPGPVASRAWRVVHTDGSRASALDQATEALREFELY